QGPARHPRHNARPILGPRRALRGGKNLLCQGHEGLSRHAVFRRGENASGGPRRQTRQSAELRGLPHRLVGSGGEKGSRRQGYGQTVVNAKYRSDRIAIHCVTRWFLSALILPASAFESPYRFCFPASAFCLFPPAAPPTTLAMPAYSRPTSRPSTYR